MAFTPFMQSTDAQSVINNYLGQNVSASTPMSPMDMNQYGVFRNPYSPTNFYANETDMYPAPTYTAPVIDNEGIPTCQAGYVYDEILKQCVHVGYGEPTQESGRTEDDPEERPYMSIEDMKNADDYELLKYLDTGWLKGNKFNSTIGGKFLPLQFQLPFGSQNKMRRDFIINELTKRGYDTGVNDKGQNTFNLGNVFGIISNAEASNLGLTPEQINYQIQAKNQADNFSGNPFAETMTEQQVIDDAVASGATSVNPFERFGINQNSGNQNNNNNTFVPSGNLGNNFYQGNKGYGDADDWSDESSGI